MSSDTETMTVEKGYKVTEIGVIPEEWEVEKLGDCVQKIVGGGTPSRKIPEYYQGAIPWVTVKDLDGSFYMSDSQEHVSEKAIAESSTNLIPMNSVIVATRMALGRGFINQRELAINQDLKALIPKHSVFPEYLLWSYLQIGREIEHQGSGSTVKGVRLELLKSILIPLPPLPEQEKIAEILSTVDEHIGETEDLIEKTETLKKGMMQRLLTQGIGHTEFKDTEIGRIPAEWEVVSTGSLGSTYEYPSPHQSLPSM